MNFRSKLHFMQFFVGRLSDNLVYYFHLFERTDTVLLFCVKNYPYKLRIGLVVILILCVGCSFAPGKPLR